ncbi:LpxD N-terminal domain-containing protein [Beijerinckia indica]|uniref:UDP-3-O-(3-hydroxymyristoyl) glucosamine N-acyltransferase LpxD n=1 Tax=Beijerinckia indica subsp. indica (strain ATCC 9039 / DSM 1715 / NCIMB 8712) TaxID=395963 RepID=B2ID91_BEII9|nr:LpxD N-terminal domain-containing protein [Beijerinckia indica]ACB93948.1 UDP-3-O-(3-hydroxymyristoyl) glucosamine N-acyltransferase LpxD [Beijerinckia indica subsp. indica ATCC 9039]
MSDPLFTPPAPWLSLAEVAALTGAQGAGDLTAHIHAVAPLENAGRGDLSFFDASQDPALLCETGATACLIVPAQASLLAPSVVPLLTLDPPGAAALVLAILFRESLRPESGFGGPGLLGVSPGAHVHPNARLETGVGIDPGAVIGPRAEIGAGSLIGAGSVIGPGVRIGRDCSIGAGVSISHALIGNEVVLAPGVRMGQSPVLTAWPVAPGRVIVQDKVVIGANSTIDRGILRDTIIGEGTRIAALVAIGADVSLGRFCRVPQRTELSVGMTYGDQSVIGV